MPQVIITALPNALALTGTEPVPIVQNGVTVQTTTGAISGAGALNYPFLTVGATSGLTQARYLTTGSGLSLTDNGIGSSLQINLLGAAQSLDSSVIGLQAKTNSNTVVGRTFGVGSGLNIANGDGVDGNPVISLGTTLSNVSSLTGTGLVTINGTNFSQVTLSTVSGQLVVTNGDGSTGSPTFGLATTDVTAGTYSSATFTVDAYGRLTAASSGTSGGVTFFSAGTTGLTPSTPTSGSITLAGVLVPSNGGTGASTLTGYVKGNGTSTMTAAATVPTTDLSGNVTNAQLANSSITINGTPVSLGGSTSVGTVTSVTGTDPVVSSGGSTPAISMPAATTSVSGYLTSTDWNTFNSKGAGSVTSVNGTGTVNGLTLTGTVTTSGSLTLGGTLSGIPNSALTNSSITINGSSVSLGGSITVTATATNALTIGTGLTGTSYNGSTPVTIAIDSSVATLNDVQTLTNKSMSGSSNTFTNIPNSALTNSQITLGTTNIALGGTSLSPVGLTSVTVTQDPTSNFQLATKQYVDTVASTGIHYHSPVYVESPAAVGNLNATYAAGGTSTTITTIASGTYITFASGVPAIGSQVTTATANGLTSGTQYWVTEIVGGTVQLSLTYGGAAITGLTNGTGLSIASTINAGVGATLTNAGTQAALTIDGVLTTVGMRVLIYSQTNATQNGVYTVTTVGTVSTNWVLTRATDANTYSPYSASALGQGDAFFVQAGATGAGETYVVSVTGSIFFGQTNITFAQISDIQVYSAGTGLTLTGTQFSISNTAVTAGSYTNANLTVNAQGQITSASSGTSGGVTQIIAGTNVTISPTGGTGAVTINSSAAAVYSRTSFIATAAQTTFSVTYTIGLIQIYVNGVLLNGSDYVATSGTDFVLSVACNSGDIVEALTFTSNSISGTVTSFSAGTTGLTPSSGATGAITLAGILNVANGGTGTSTPSLVAGTNITITGTWPNQTVNSTGGGATYPGAGIPNSTGSAWGTSYTTTGSGSVVALATSPTLTTPVITSLVAQNSNTVKTPYSDAGLIPGELIYRLNTAYVGSNVNTAQSIFGVGVTLSANTVYQFEINFAIYKTAGTTSHTTALSFGGTATINNIMYSGPLGNLAATSPASGFDSAGSVVMAFVATSVVVTGSSTVAAITKTFNLIGTVSIASGGTFIPQYTNSAGPGAAYTTAVGSFIKLSPIGASGSNTSIGTWA